MLTLFLLLRVTTGLMAAAGLLVLLLIILLRSGAAFLKESAGVLGYVVALFTSGFTKGTAPKDPAGWVVSLPQAGLAILFVAMLIALFYPGAKIFLHLVAALAGVALIWYVRMLLTEVELEIFCLPLLAVWFFYYALCIFWRGPEPFHL
jgi:hypothetical protein